MSSGLAQWSVTSDPWAVSGEFATIRFHRLHGNTTNFFMSDHAARPTPALARTR